MTPRWKIFVLGAAAVFLSVGCNASSSSTSPPASADGTTSGATQPASGPSGTSAPTTSATDQADDSGITKIPREALPVGDYMPPLDDDRIEIAKPKDWQALPRDADYLTRFYETNRNGLPRIEVTVEARTFGDLTTVTAENVEPFAKQVATDLGDLELVEKVRPLLIGGVPCARYVSRVDLKLSGGQTINAERQRLLVLNGGRLYTIDLIVLPNTLLRSRDAAYAACASLRFGGATPTPPTGELLPE